MEASLTDGAIERLLRYTGESELDELNDFVLALKKRSLDLAPDVRNRHVALAAAAAIEAVVQPARRPPARAPVSKRRRLTLASLTSGLSLKLLLGAAALAAVGSGAAVTGLLPEPAADVAGSFTDPVPVISVPAELPNEPTVPQQLPASDTGPASTHEPSPAANHGRTVSEHAQQQQPVDCQTAWELALVAAARAGERPSAPACATGVGTEPGPADTVPGNKSTESDGKAESPPHTEQPESAGETPGPPTGAELGPPHSVPAQALPRR